MMYCAPQWPQPLQGVRVTPQLLHGKVPGVAECKVDVCGKNCPQPLVEFRKAVRNTAPGDIIEITGTHPESKKEIPMAAKALKVDVLSIDEEGGKWTIKVRR